MTFNLECSGCVSRGIPFLKRLHAEFGSRVQLLAVHTSFGHRRLPREDVEPTLLKFSRDFARLPFPVALDLDGAFARHWRTEGTPTGWPSRRAASCFVASTAARTMRRRASSTCSRSGPGRMPGGNWQKGS
ncbi:hypothetical protein ACFSC4_19455 [Deinococcus malanensis]|uniref:hypothetical protein n=1 Tax=Deinococcus malanensis TaxID=1706855 RepID=UPI003632C8A9